MDATPAASLLSPRPGLRRPLATARPGLDYLRHALGAAWDEHGASGIGDLAAAFLQAAAGTPETDTDLAAVARWATRLQAGSVHALASRC